MKLKAFIPAILWLITSTILLSLPGKDIPDLNLFSNFDKVVHTGMFFLLTTFFCYPFISSGLDTSLIKSKFISIAFCVLAYGILMEFVQKYFVPGRSFDVVDIIFDGVGSFVALFTMLKIYYKKIGPDGNRGRNQN